MKNDDNVQWYLQVGFDLDFFDVAGTNRTKQPTKKLG